MDTTLFSVLIGIIAGAIGYWISTFYVQPVLRFREVRNQILRDFIYYAQVVNAEGLSEDMQKLFNERILANRKASAQLSSAVLDLPRLYRCFFKRRCHNSKLAATSLIGFSNTYDYDQASKVEGEIRTLLGLPNN